MSMTSCRKILIIADDDDAVTASIGRIAVSRRADDYEILRATSVRDGGARIREHQLRRRPRRHRAEAAGRLVARLWPWSMIPVSRCPLAISRCRRLTAGDSIRTAGDYPL
jgi:hypothetical protein